MGLFGTNFEKHIIIIGWDDFDIQEYHVTSQNPFSGKTYGEAFQKIKKELNSILMGLSTCEENKENC